MRKLLIAAIILAGLLLAACRCTWRSDPSASSRAGSG
jgi:outer membrane murein-binding lipoprotein Lpp